VRPTGAGLTAYGCRETRAGLDCYLYTQSKVSGAFGHSISARNPLAAEAKAGQNGYGAPAGRSREYVTRGRQERGRLMSSAQDQPPGTADKPITTTAEGGVPGQRPAQETAGYREPVESRQAEGRRTQEYREPEYRESADRRPEAQRRHYGMAATLMILSGLLTCFIGIVGLIKGVFFNTVATYPFYFSVRGRGVTLLIIGAVVFVVGVALLFRMDRARHVATVVTVASGIANFLFIPFYPFWSIVLFALDVLIVWELTREDRGRREYEDRGRRDYEDRGGRDYEGRGRHEYAD